MVDFNDDSIQALERDPSKISTVSPFLAKIVTTRNEEETSEKEWNLELI